MSGIRQRYGAKDLAGLLYNMVMLTTSLFIKAETIRAGEKEGGKNNELQQAILKFEDSLLNPKFTDIAEKVKKRATIRNVNKHDINRYEISFDVEGGATNYVKGGGTVTLTFEDHAKEADPFSFVDLKMSAGVIAGEKLFTTLASVLSQASSLTHNPVLNEIGQVFQTGLANKNPFYSSASSVKTSFTRHMRWAKSHEAPASDFKHIWTRNLKRKQAKFDMEVAIPNPVPGLKVKAGGGYSDLKTSLLSEKDTGNTLFNWMERFMAGVDKETGAIKEDSAWQNMENTQEQGLQELFTNKSIENEIAKMRAAVKKNGYLNAIQKENFVRAAKNYVEATHSFQHQTDTTHYEACLEKLRNLFFTFEPHRSTTKSGLSLSHDLTAVSRNNGRWVAVKLNDQQKIDA